MAQILFLRFSGFYLKKGQNWPSDLSNVLAVLPENLVDISGIEADRRRPRRAPFPEFGGDQVVVHVAASHLFDAFPVALVFDAA